MHTIYLYKPFANGKKLYETTRAVQHDHTQGRMQKGFPLGC